MSKTGYVGIILALALAASACNSTTTVSLPPTPATGSPGSPGGSLPGTYSPRPDSSATPSEQSPRPLLGTPNKNATGQATAGVTGDAIDVDLSFETMIGYPYYFGVGEDASLTWQDESGSTLGLGGTVYRGTRPTGGANFLLTLTVVGQTPQPISIASGDESCDVTISVAKTHIIRGSFECDAAAAPGTDQTYQVSGKFVGRVAG